MVTHTKYTLQELRKIYKNAMGAYGIVYTENFFEYLKRNGKGVN